MTQRFTYNSREYEFRFPTEEDHIARQMTNGFYEHAMLEAVRDLNLQGVYIDVGAHVGNHTLFFANECSSTQVIALEPSADTFKCLEENVRFNLKRPASCVTLHQESAGQQGQSVVQHRRNEQNTGMDQFVLHDQGRGVITIDSLSEKFAGPVALLKFDIEGFEEHALRGALRVIQKDHPVLVIEAADENALKAQEQILTPIGYSRGKCWNSTPTYFWTPRAQICVVITTYNRPAELRLLLDDLLRERGNRELLVMVYDDCSTADYTPVRSLIEEQGWIYIRTDSNFGRARFAELFGLIFSRLKSISFDTLFFLQDDVRLCSSFFDRTLSTWQSIKDPRKLTLNLHIDRARESSRSWTRATRRLVGQAELTGWVDCLFLAERKFLRALEYRMAPISIRRWRGKPRLGSGVGEQFSRRLNTQKWHLYRVRQSLLYHTLIPSQLNPLDRVYNRCATVRFADGADSLRRLITRETIIASMATVPSRVQTLQRAVNSLLDQVDRLNIYLNGFSSVPPFLDHAKIVVATSKQSGDKGDAGKFWWAATVSGYHFTVDDDIRYPPEYCEVLIKTLESFQNRVVAGVHGVLLAEPFRSYFGSRKIFHFEASLEQSQFVHILGTGTVAYHTSTLRFDPSTFEKRNMADIYFASLAQSRQVPLLCIARGKRWLNRLECRGPSIYSQARQNEGVQETELIKSLGSWRIWSTFSPPPAEIAR